MKIGISTYALLWEFTSPDQEPLNEPLSLKEMLGKAKELGGEVFQICDYEPLESMSENEIALIARLAKELDMEIELGTRGVEPDHLLKYLKLAQSFDTTVVRTMINSKRSKPSINQAIEWIQNVLPDYKEANVSLSLENYEQVKVKDLVYVVKQINDRNVGICLDPPNTIMEGQKEVIQELAPYVNNLHVKDFTMSRRNQWVGFSVVGCPLGEGYLELDYMLNHLKNENKTPNAIIELWLPFQDTLENTRKMEDEWIKKSIDHLRRKIS
ncbi:sugar phosphate isomerase/epimerase [Alteribacillus sp. YIM 98480]|uniref:sugar phosphate isomerase/epimerase family protein n=1 Tax=Alteribacillus sp. YIM 98480 TaxID=2606599 RepID=UPI00131D4714|nr:TIM barrel protein [Alteribacillus sp. YIM 98480]